MSSYTALEIVIVDPGVPSIRSSCSGWVRSLISNNSTLPNSVTTIRCPIIDGRYQLKIAFSGW